MLYTASFSAVDFLLWAFCSLFQLFLLTKLECMKRYSPQFCWSWSQNVCITMTVQACCQGHNLWSQSLWISWQSYTYFVEQINRFDFVSITIRFRYVTRRICQCHDYRLDDRHHDAYGVELLSQALLPGLNVGIICSRFKALSVKRMSQLSIWPMLDCQSYAVLFCSLAVLDPRVGHTMEVLSPFIPVLCHSDWLFHGESCPRLDVVHPGRACRPSWPSSPSCTWHCSLHYLFLQATPLFPHCMTIVC